MQQADAGLVPALNDNLSPGIAAGLEASLAALRGFTVPDGPRRSAVCRAFISFRFAALAQQAASDRRDRVAGHPKQAWREASGRLARTACSRPLDLAMKALALHALANAQVAEALQGLDPDPCDVLDLADFAAWLASDALALAGSAGL